MKQLLFLAMTVSLVGSEILTVAPGVQKINTPIVINRSNVIIDGKDAAFLKLADHANRPMLVIGDLKDPPEIKVTNVVIKNLYLDGNYENQDSEYCTELPYLRNNCITIRNASNVIIENVVTCRARSGGLVLEKDCSNIAINGLVSYENYFDGLAMCETTNIVVMNSSLHSNIAAGLSMDWRSHDNRFLNIKFFLNRDHAIYMRDSCRNLFFDLDIRHTGIYLDQHDKDVNSHCSFNLFVGISRDVPIFVGSPSCQENVIYSK